MSQCPTCGGRRGLVGYRPNPDHPESSTFAYKACPDAWHASGSVRPQTEILSAVQVAALAQRHGIDTIDSLDERLLRLCASHEALRSRVEEAEAERDQWKTAWHRDHMPGNKNVFAWKRDAEQSTARVVALTRALAELLDASDAVTNSLPGEAYGELERYNAAKVAAWAAVRDGTPEET